MNPPGHAPSHSTHLMEKDGTDNMTHHHEEHLTVIPILNRLAWMEKCRPKQGNNHSTGNGDESVRLVLEPPFGKDFTATGFNCPIVECHHGRGIQIHIIFGFLGSCVVPIMHFVPHGAT